MILLLDNKFSLTSKPCTKNLIITQLYKTLNSVNLRTKNMRTTSEKYLHLKKYFTRRQNKSLENKIYSIT